MSSIIHDFPARGNHPLELHCIISIAERWTSCWFVPLATIIFEFLFCASAQGEDSKEKRGGGGKEERKENPF